MTPRFASVIVLMLSLAGARHARALPPSSTDAGNAGVGAGSSSQDENWNGWPPPRPRPEYATEVAGAFLIGILHVDQSALNRRLTESGYQRLSPTLTLVGGEGRAVLTSGVVVGARGSALVSEGGRGPGNWNTRLDGAMGMLNLGYALFRAETLSLTLTADIGAYGLSLELSQQDPADFDEILAEPGRSVSLRRGGILTGLTLGLEAHVPLAVEQWRHFVSVGVRLSALYGPPVGDWGSEGGEVSAGPALQLTGGYAALSFGFGSSAEHRSEKSVSRD
jgi:hypothetical protein